uniref:Beta-1,4-galactosyltransferase n=1 Tax=Echeneis naucrates TaxID=173247 RepID=A0A665UKS3_ECHNA
EEGPSQNIRFDLSINEAVVAIFTLGRVPFKVIFSLNIWVGSIVKRAFGFFEYLVSILTTVDSLMFLSSVGPLRVEFNIPVNLDQVKEDNPNLQPGGRYKPKDCEALQKVAVIIPFRKREEHLKYWLFYLHPILQRQQLDYGVYVINQDGDEIFNRAKLLNVGYVEALKEYDYDCFVFSDVDLIPMDDRNTYRCFSQPRHLSVAMDKFGFRLPYNQYFGGVSSMSKEQYLKINGFPNNYWGWGGEDDDIYNRLTTKGMSISRPSGEVGKCRMIRHQRDKQNEPNPQRFNRIAHTRETMHKDGFNSLSYKLVRVDKLDLFTMITVDVGSPEGGVAEGHVTGGGG